MAVDDEKQVGFMGPILGRVRRILFSDIDTSSHNVFANGGGRNNVQVKNTMFSTSEPQPQVAKHGKSRAGRTRLAKCNSSLTNIPEEPEDGIPFRHVQGNDFEAEKENVALPSVNKRGLSQVMDSLATASYDGKHCQDQTHDTAGITPRNPLKNDGGHAIFVNNTMTRPQLTARRNRGLAQVKDSLAGSSADYGYGMSNEGSAYTEECRLFLCHSENKDKTILHKKKEGSQTSIIGKNRHRRGRCRHQLSSLVQNQQPLLSMSKRKSVVSSLMNLPSSSEKSHPARISNHNVGLTHPIKLRCKNGDQKLDRGSLSVAQEGLPTSQAVEKFSIDQPHDAGPMRHNKQNQSCGTLRKKNHESKKSSSTQGSQNKYDRFGNTCTMGTLGRLSTLTKDVEALKIQGDNIAGEKSQDPQRNPCSRVYVTNNVSAGSLRRFVPSAPSPTKIDDVASFSSESSLQLTNVYSPLLFRHKQRSSSYLSPSRLIYRLSSVSSSKITFSASKSFSPTSGPNPRKRLDTRKTPVKISSLTFPLSSGFDITPCNLTHSRFDVQFAQKENNEMPVMEGEEKNDFIPETVALVHSDDKQSPCHMSTCSLENAIRVFPLTTERHIAPSNKNLRHQSKVNENNVTNPASENAAGENIVMEVEHAEHEINAHDRTGSATQSTCTLTSSLSSEKKFNIYSSPHDDKYLDSTRENFVNTDKNKYQNVTNTEANACFHAVAQASQGQYNLTLVNGFEGINQDCSRSEPPDSGNQDQLSNAILDIIHIEVPDNVLDAEMADSTHFLKGIESSSSYDSNNEDLCSRVSDKTPLLEIGDNSPIEEMEGRNAGCEKSSLSPIIYVGGGDLSTAHNLILPALRITNSSPGCSSHEKSVSRGKHEDPEIRDSQLIKQCSNAKDQATTEDVEYKNRIVLQVDSASIESIEPVHDDGGKSFSPNGVDQPGVGRQTLICGQMGRYVDARSLPSGSESNQFKPGSSVVSIETATPRPAKVRGRCNSAQDEEKVSIWSSNNSELANAKHSNPRDNETCNHDVETISGDELVTAELSFWSSNNSELANAKHSDPRDNETCNHDVETISGDELTTAELCYGSQTSGIMMRSDDCTQRDLETKHDDLTGNDTCQNTKKIHEDPALEIDEFCDLDIENKPDQVFEIVTSPNTLEENEAPKIEDSKFDSAKRLLNGKPIENGRKPFHCEDQNSDNIFEDVGPAVMASYKTKHFPFSEARALRRSARRAKPTDRLDISWGCEGIYSSNKPHLRNSDDNLGWETNHLPSNNKSVDQKVEPREEKTIPKEGNELELQHHSITNYNFSNETSIRKDPDNQYLDFNGKANDSESAAFVAFLPKSHSSQAVSELKIPAEEPDKTCSRSESCCGDTCHDSGASNDILLDFNKGDIVQKEGMNDEKSELKHGEQQPKPGCHQDVDSNSKDLCNSEKGIGDTENAPFIESSMLRRSKRAPKPTNRLTITWKTKRSDKSRFNNVISPGPPAPKSFRKRKTTNNNNNENAEISHQHNLSRMETGAKGDEIEKCSSLVCKPLSRRESSPHSFDKKILEAEKRPETYDECDKHSAKNKKSIPILEDSEAAKVSQNRGKAPFFSTPLEETEANIRQESQWTASEMTMLRKAHMNVNPTSANFWREVASFVGGKTSSECSEKWFSLVSTPKCQKGRIANESSDDDDGEDDLFDSTPMRESIFEAPVEPGILALSRVNHGFEKFFELSPFIQQKLETHRGENSPLRSRRGYKTYIEGLRKEVNCVDKKKKSNTQKCSKSDVLAKQKKICAISGNGNIQMHGRLLPDGAVELNGPTESDLDDTYDSCDDELEGKEEN